MSTTNSNNYAAENLAIKLDRQRRVQKQWDKCHRHNERFDKEVILGGIDWLESEEESRGLCRTDTDLLFEARRDINANFKKEDIMWRQRARCRWVKDGDANTAYFHKVPR